MSTLIEDFPLYEESSARHGRVLSEKITAGLVALIDASLIIISGTVIYFLYVNAQEINALPAYAAVLALMSYLVIQAFFIAGLYRFDAIRSPTRQAGKIISIFTIVFLLLVASGFFLKISDDFSRVWVIATSVLAITNIFVGRIIMLRVLRRLARSGRLTRKIMIYGAVEETEDLLDHFSQMNEPWNKVIGVFDDRWQRNGGELRGVPIRGGLQDLIHCARSERAEEIVVALPWNSLQGRIKEIFHSLSVLPTNIRLCPDRAVMAVLSRPLDYRHGLPMIGVLDTPMTDWSAIAKRVFDFCVSGTLLLFLAPLLVTIMIGVKLDSRGPVFFRQRRYGFNNELIEVWKFRTMKADQQDVNAERLATYNDPRVTRFGSLLRKTSLDELPQLYNVFNGSMSLVGPRPHALKAKAGNALYQDVVIQYAKRHRVKPGITGWAQVNGWRGETDTEEKIIKRVEHDLYYIDNWSIWLDIRILLRTVGVVFSRENAY
jgi:Undecaprenyl-phosphate glucose phosphotransferase